MPVLLCYGDSNTHGSLPRTEAEKRSRLGLDERWPGVAATALGTGWQVVEEGLPGRTTVHDDPVKGDHLNGLDGLPIALNSHRPIDVVALMLGTNDLKSRFAVTAEEIRDSLERLLDIIARSDCGPDEGAPATLLIAPPPVLEDGRLGSLFVGAAAKSAYFKALFGELARGRGIGFLDAGTIIASSPIDGVHFDAEAHAKLGRAVAEVVTASFPSLQNKFGGRPLMSV